MFTEKGPNTNPAQYGKEAWNLTLFAEDVKIQAGNEHNLQELLTAAGDWAVHYGMNWNIKKCTTVRDTGQQWTPSLKLQGQGIRNDTKAEYLGVTESSKGTNTDANIRRIQRANITGLKLKHLGLHSGTLTMATVLQI